MSGVEPQSALLGLASILKAAGEKKQALSFQAEHSGIRAPSPRSAPVTIISSRGRTVSVEPHPSLRVTSNNRTQRSSRVPEGRIDSKPQAAERYASHELYCNRQRHGARNSRFKGESDDPGDRPSRGWIPGLRRRAFGSLQNKHGPALREAGRERSFSD